MLRFVGAGVSDVGLVRVENEDSAYVGFHLALVADGVGGAAAGEVASATAAHAVIATALARPDDDPEAVLLDAAHAALGGIQRGIQDDLNRLGMATTLTAVVCDGRRTVVGHVGDSRAYLCRAGVLTALTSDHTYVQRLVSTGQLAPEDVPRHPWRNVVLRSLDGDPLHGGIDLVEVDLAAGDRLLLCSDGLTDPVPEPRIAQLVSLPDPHHAAAALSQAALAAGGRDNITAVVLDVHDGDRSPDEGHRLGALRDAANIVDPTAARVGMRDSSP